MKDYKEEYDPWDDPAITVGAETTPQEAVAPESPQAPEYDPWDDPAISKFATGGETLTTEEPEDDGLTLGEVAGDVGAVFGRGAGGLASGLGWIADKLGADDVGESLQLIGKSATDYYTKKLSPEARAELDKEFVTTREGGKWYNPFDWERPEDAAGLYTAFLMGIESLPATMTGMGVGGKIGQGLFKVAEKTGTLRGLQKAAELGRKASATGAAATDDIVRAGKKAERIINTFGKTTGAIGYGIGEAVPAAGMAGMQVEEEVFMMDHDRLWKNSTHYREFFAATEGLNMTMDERIADAKENLAEVASSQAGLEAGVATFLLGAPAGATTAALINKGITKPFATGKIAGTVKGAGEEALQEFAQSGTEQYVSNLAIKEYADETLDVSRGVINAAIGGAVSGAGMGAAFGAAGTPTKGAAQKQAENEETAKKLQDDRYKLQEFGARAHAALTTEFAVDSADAMAMIDPIISEYAQTENVVKAVSSLRHLETYGRPREEGVDDQAGSYENIPLTQEAERNGVAYFQIDGTVGQDGGRIDAMMPVQQTGTNIFVAQQVKADGTPDEDKVILGVATEEEAVAAYQRYYRGFDDEQDRNIGGISAMNETEFADWMRGATEEYGTNIPTSEVITEQEKERAELEQAEEPMESVAEAPATEEIATTEAITGASAEETVVEDVPRGTPAEPAAEDDTGEPPPPAPLPVLKEKTPEKTEVISTDTSIERAKGEAKLKEQRARDKLRFSLSSEGMEASGDRILWDKKKKKWIDNKDYAEPGKTKWADRYINRELDKKDDSLYGNVTAKRRLRNVMTSLRAGNVDEARAAWKELARVKSNQSASPVDSLWAVAVKAGLDVRGDYDKEKMIGRYRPTKSKLWTALEEWASGQQKLALETLLEDAPEMEEGTEEWADKFIREVEKNAPYKEDGRVKYPHKGRVSSGHGYKTEEKLRSILTSLQTGDVRQAKKVYLSLLSGDFTRAHTNTLWAIAVKAGTGVKPTSRVYVTKDESRGALDEWAAGGQAADIGGISEQEQQRREQASERMRNYNKEQQEKSTHAVKLFMRKNWSQVEADVDAATAGAITPDEVQDAIIEWIMKGTDSKYFKRWFGDSQTKDQWGVPIRFYHGTGSDFTAFNEKKGRGFVSLSTDPDFAGGFAEEFQLDSMRPIMYSVYVSAQKIFDGADRQMRRSFMRWYKKAKGRKFVDADRMAARSWSTMEHPDVKQFMKQRGYDAFWMREGNTVNLGVFDPRNIKSAVGNVGTFSREHNDLRYSLTSPKTGDVFFSQIERWVNEKMPPTANRNEIINGFKSPKALGKKGIKKEEVEDMGLLDWLESKTEKKISKEDMLEFVRATKVDFIEVELRPDMLTADSGTSLTVTNANNQVAILEDQIGSQLREAGVPEEETHRIMQDLNSIGISALDGFLNPNQISDINARMDMARLDQWQADFRAEAASAMERDRIDLETKYEQHSLTQGSRPTYREFLMKIPKRQGVVPYSTRHWEDQNVLVHMRMHGQFDSDTGKTTLIVEEVQSDWHQQGYRYGYTEGMLEEEQKKLLREEGKVPPAPMALNWKMLGMKRLIRYAAENGYDEVAWATGSVQRERYTLKGRVGQVRLERDPSMDNSYRLGFKHGLMDSEQTTEWVPRHRIGFDFISEELSDKLFAKLEAGEEAVLRGDELDWDATALKAFYDHNLKKETNKYIKKWRSKVELKDQQVVDVFGISQDVPLWTFQITEEMREAVLAGQSLYSMSPDIGTEIGRRIELYQLRDYIEKNTDSKTKPRAMKARLIDGMERGFYSSQILHHSGVLRNVNNRSKMLMQIASRVRGRDVTRRTSLNAGVVRQELARITKDWANPPMYRVHETWQTLPSHIRSEALQWNYTEMLEGVYDPMDGMIHIVAGNLHTMDRLYKSFIEESLGHSGLREFFGKEFDGFLEEALPSIEGSEGWNNLLRMYSHLDDAIAAADEEIAKAKKAGRKPNESVLTRAHQAKLAAAEELIAKQDVEQSVWEKFVSWLRGWLRDRGFNISYTDEDLRYVMAQVHNKVINGTTPHPWGQRNHTPVFTSGLFRYSLYGGEDGLMLSKVERAIKNKKLINNQDRAKPRVWLDALRGQNQKDNWAQSELSKKVAQKWAFSEAELELTGIIPFLLDRLNTAPHEKITQDEVVQVFLKTRPKIMAVSRAGHFLFPALPFADLITTSTIDSMSSFDENRASQEYGYFSDYLIQLLDEEDHKELKKYFPEHKDDPEPLTPGKLWAMSSVKNPFGEFGIPDMSAWLRQGLSTEQISQEMGIRNYREPVRSGNINAMIKGGIAAKIIAHHREMGSNAFRMREFTMGVGLHGYRYTESQIKIAYTTDKNGQPDAAVYAKGQSGNENLDELIAHLNQKLDAWKKQRESLREFIQRREELGQQGEMLYGPTQQTLDELFETELKNFVAQKIDDIQQNQMVYSGERIATEEGDEVILSPNLDNLIPEFPGIGKVLAGAMTNSVSSTKGAEYRTLKTGSPRSADLWDQYTLRGGQNLDVISIQMYGRGRNESLSGSTGTTHYDEGLAQDVVHMRVKEREGPNGERIAAIDELQSDWASSYRGAPATREARRRWSEEHGLTAIEALKWVQEEYGIKPNEPYISRWMDMRIHSPGETQDEQQWLDDHLDEFAHDFRNEILMSKTGVMLMLKNPELKNRMDKAIKAHRAMEVSHVPFPWISKYADLGMSAMVAWARDAGFDGVAWYNYGGTAADLYGHSIGEKHNAIRIDLQRMRLYGGNTRIHTADNIPWETIAEANRPSGAGGYYNTDYLMDIVREGGENGEVAKVAVDYLDNFIENGGIEYAKDSSGLQKYIDENAHPRVRYNSESGQLYISLPDSRHWNARIHKTLYGQLMPQAAKGISKKSYGKIYFKDAVNAKTTRGDSQYAELNTDFDRVEGPMTGNNRLGWSSRVFGRNASGMRERMVNWLQTRWTSVPAISDRTPIMRVEDVISRLVPVEMKLMSTAVLTSSDGDHGQPYTGIHKLSYEVDGETKYLTIPIVDWQDPFLGINVSEADDIDGDSIQRMDEFTVPLMARAVESVMRNIWGIKNPDPWKLGRHGIISLYGNMFRGYARWLKENVDTDTAFEQDRKIRSAWGRSRDLHNTTESWVEPHVWTPAWQNIELLDGMEPMQMKLALPPQLANAELNDTLNRMREATLKDQFGISQVRSVLIPSFTEDSEYDAELGEMMTGLPAAVGDDPAEVNHYSVDNIPKAYLEGLPEYAGSGADGQYDIDNPQHPENVWQVLWIDDAVKKKEIFTPFSLHDSNREERELVNSKITKPVSRMTLLDRSTQWLNRTQDMIRTGDFMWGIKQGLVDSAASVERWEREIFGQVMDASVSPHKMMHMTKNLPSVMAAIGKAGIPALQDGVFQPVNGRKGFVEIFRPIYEHPDGDLLELWEGYAAARRSTELLEQRNPDGTDREKLFTREEVDKLLALGDKYPVFRNVFDDWTNFNNDLLNLAVETGVLGAAERDAWQANAYVPFYRAMEEIEGIDQRTGWGRVKQGVEGQHHGIRRLRGGKQKLGSIVENMWFNTASLIDKVYKNEAMNRVVDMLDGVAMHKVDLPWEAVKVTNSQIAAALTSAGLLTGDAEAQVRAMSTEQRMRWNTIFRRVRPTADNVVSVMRDGKLVYYEIPEDEALLRTLQGMGAEGMVGMMKAMGMSKALLTRMITIDPGFMLANWMRDTLSAWVTSDANFVPVADSVKAMGAVFKEDGAFVKMMMSGAGGGGFYDLTGGNVQRALDEELNRGPVSWMAKTWRGYMKLGAASENSNRLAIANKIMKRGGTAAEAMYQAQDILNFTMSGDYNAVRFLIRTVPFLNARMQGIYRLYRGARDHKLGFALKGAALMFASLALLARNWGDDDYEVLEEWMKDMNWNFFVDGMHYTIPKPFEVGLLFGTLPERLTRLMLGRDDLPVAQDALLRGLGETLAFNPIPQLFKPMYELGANKNLFTGRPIENLAAQGYEYQYRAHPWTSPVAQRIGAAMPEWSGPFQSPLKIQHAIRAYTGTVGLYTLNSLDWLLRQADDSFPPMPEKHWYERPVISRVIKGPVETTRYNKYAEKLYDAISASDQAQKSFNMLARTDREDEAKVLARKRGSLMNPDIDIETGKALNPDVITMRKELASVRKKLSEISKIQRTVIASKSMDSKKKREQIDHLTIARNQTLSEAAKLLKMLDEEKRNR